jgi:hypothetical protein
MVSRKSLTRVLSLFRFGFGSFGPSVEVASKASSGRSVGLGIFKFSVGVLG